MRSSLKIGAAALSFGLIACGSPPTAPASDGAGIDDLLYTCGAGGPFDPERLDGDGDLEHADTSLGDALRRLLSTPDGTMGGEGWRIVRERDDNVVVAAPTDSREHPYVSAFFEGDGVEWRPVGWGDCLPVAVVGTRSPALWQLEAPARGDPLEVRLLVEERACSSGRQLNEENTRADIEYRDDEIVILMTADPLHAGKGAAFTCIGVPPASIAVTLEEPVRGRRLVDAAVYPPARRDR